MILTRLQTTNWGCLRSLDISFSEGLTGILGPNGSGKSTLLDAIRFATVGESVAVGPKSENITVGERSGSVTLNFTHGDSLYEIKRILEPSRQQLKFPGGTVGRQAEIEEKMTNLLNTRMDALLNNVFIAQHAIDDILFKTNTERLKEFQDTFGLSKAAEVYKLLSTEISTLTVTPGLEQQLQVTADATLSVSKELADLRAQLKAIEEELLELSKFEDRLRHYRIAQQSASAKKQTEEALTLAQQRYDEALNISNAAVDAHDIIVQRFSNLSIAAAEQAKELDQAKVIFAQRNALTIEMARLEANLIEPREEKDVYSARVARSVEAITKLKAIINNEAPLPQMEEDKILADRVEVLTKQLSELQRDDPRLGVIEADIHRIQHELKTFAGGACPTCLRPIDNFDDAALKTKSQELQTEKAKIKDDQATRVAEAKRQLTVISTELTDRRKTACKAVESSLAVVTQQHAEFARLEKDLISVWDAYTRNRSRVDDITVQLDKLPQVPPEKLEALQKSVESFKVLQVEVAKAESHATTKKAVRASCSQEVIRLKDLLLKVGDSEFNLSDQELAEAQQKIEILSARTQTRSELMTKIGVADAKLIQLSSSVDQLKRQYDHEHNAAKWSTLCSRAREIVHVNGLPSLMMREYANKINKRMAYYMSIWEAPFQFYLDGDLSFRAKFNNGFELPAHRLSGGQKIVASTSFRLAMSDTFARSVGLLILDEPTNHLDESNVVHLQQLLIKLKQFSGSTGRQILIVTHAESLTSFFDQTIKLSKKE